MKTTSVDLEERQRELLEKMDKNGDVANQSEAVRDAIEYYGAEMGYTAIAEKGETRLKVFTQRLAWAFALIGVVWMATTLAAPVALRLPAYGALSASVGMFGIHRVLDAHEPAITQRIRALIGGEAT